ncbi:CBS domain-containing protein [Serpentinicella alkaliphila]|uniref:CBS domain protein n=1 Tax=Serpentinicella alkaliphila TaxID=1734049 RepID=A0A4R2TX14_9FIRM|nr:CBS domain-containing protein [Serpentinicella alkaliphila]QUH26038.1 CBS domain-containing protein [Serpentinicella alkaliphila]TCP99732.1 CBS domain protein [Serpentinicella alkaliphila]
MDLFARDIMTKKVITVTKDNSVYEAIEKLLTYKINCLPVVDEEGHLIGMVTETDLVYVDRKLNPSNHYAYSELNVPVNKRILERDISHMKDIKIGDVMSKTLTTLREDSTLESAIDIMINKKIKTIPVLNNSKVCGIITRRDILKFYIKNGLELANTKC